MKKINKRQYIATLIVCFCAIAILSFCTIQAFYKKAVDDTLSVGESALKQQKEQMDAYLSRGMDAVELTAITVEYMLRENYSGDDILDFLTQESKYYKRDVDKSFTGIYGLFNGEYRKQHHRALQSIPQNPLRKARQPDRHALPHGGHRAHGRPL